MVYAPQRRHAVASVGFWLLFKTDLAVINHSARSCCPATPLRAELLGALRPLVSSIAYVAAS